MVCASGVPSWPSSRYLWKYVLISKGYSKPKEGLVEYTTGKDGGMIAVMGGHIISFESFKDCPKTLIYDSVKDYSWWVCLWLGLMPHIAINIIILWWFNLKRWNKTNNAIRILILHIYYLLSVNVVLHAFASAISIPQIINTIKLERITE